MSAPINIDLSQYQESLKLINSALNKACKSGTFNIDEAYIIKIAFSTIEKALEQLDTSEKKPNENPVNVTTQDTTN